MRVQYAREHEQEYLNTTNQALTWIFRANTDLQLCGNHHACTSYMTAYVSKHEKDDVTKVLLRDLMYKLYTNDVNITVKKVMGQLMQQAHAARFTGVQEAMQILLSFKIVQCSSKFVHLNVFPKHRRHATVMAPSRKPGAEIDPTDVVVHDSKAMMDYEHRPASLKHRSMLYWAGNCEVVSDKQSVMMNRSIGPMTGKYPGLACFRIEQHVVKLSPPIRSDDNSEDSCHSMLIAFKPFYNESSLIPEGSTAVIEYSKWKQHMLQHPGSYVDELRWINRSVQLAVEQKEFIEMQAEQAAERHFDIEGPVARDEVRELLGEYETAAYMPEQLSDPSLPLMINNVGVTSAADYMRWTAEQKQSARGWVKIMEQRQNAHQTADDDEVSTETADFVSSTRLNSGQQLAYNIITTALDTVYANNTINKRIAGRAVIVTGPGGTGKTTMIKHVIQYCAQQWPQLKPRESTVLTAYTGAAAHIINGQTINSMFGDLRKQGTMEAAKNKKKTQDRFAKVRLVVVDEFSMCTADYLQFIHSQLQTARQNTLPWGGFVVVLCGDPMQLPPISLTSLMNPLVCPTGARNHRSERAQLGLQLWHSITDVVVLEAVERLDNTADPRYGQLLSALRNRAVTPELHSYLNSHMRPTIPAFRSMKPGSMITSYLNTDVHALNMRELRTQQIRTVSCWCTHTQSLTDSVEKGSGRNARPVTNAALNILALKEKSKEAPACIQLGVGAHVRLTYNLCVSLGLVNGATGVVVGFIYVQRLNKTAEGSEEEVLADMTSTDPEYISNNHVQTPIVLVNLDKQYWRAASQRTFSVQHGDRVIPVTARQGNKEAIQPRLKGIPMGNYNRHQLPLIVAYCCTLHKTQGLTLNGCHADIPDRYMTPMVLYVALSRVRRSEDFSMTQIVQPKHLLMPDNVMECWKSLVDRAALTKQSQGSQHSISNVHITNNSKTAATPEHYQHTPTPNSKRTTYSGRSSSDRSASSQRAVSNSHRHLHDLSTINDNQTAAPIRGLMNNNNKFANTCCFNAATQCILSVPLFAQIIADKAQQFVPKNVSTRNSNQHAIVTSYAHRAQQAIERIRQLRTATPWTIELQQQWLQHCNDSYESLMHEAQLTAGQQHDASEIIIKGYFNVFPQIFEACLSNIRTVVTCNNTACNHSEQKTTTNTTAEHGRDISTTHRYSTTSITMLGVVKAASGFEAAINSSTETTTDYNCTHCNLAQHINSCTITTTRQSAPTVMIIVLRRAVYNQQQRKNIFTTQLTSYPEKFKLTTQPHDNNNNTATTAYRLQASVLHKGTSLRSGHYRAAVKHNNNWLLTDDHRPVVSAAVILQPNFDDSSDSNTPESSAGEQQLEPSMQTYILVYNQTD